MRQPASLTCAACEHPWTADVTVSLNAQRDEEDCRAFAEGTMNAFECPECGAVTRVRTPIVYHDMQARLFVNMLPGTPGPDWPLQEEQAYEMFQRLRKEAAGEELLNYRFRLCFGENELREKIVLSATELDDRIVELLKLGLLDTQEISEVVHDHGAALLFDGFEKDGHLRLVAFVPADRERSLVLRIPRTAYDDLARVGVPESGVHSSLREGLFVSYRRYW